MTSFAVTSFAVMSSAVTKLRRWRSNHNQPKLITITERHHQRRVITAKLTTSESVVTAQLMTAKLITRS